MQAKGSRANCSTGEAEAAIAIATAKAEALLKVAQSLRSNGGEAAALSVAEQYVKAFSELAKTNNTLILSADAANVSSTVAQVCPTFPSELVTDSDRGTRQAMQVYKTLARDQGEKKGGKS